MQLSGKYFKYYLLLCTVVLLVVTYVWYLSKSPTYAGVSIHEWIIRAANNELQAKQALEVIDTNAIPVLLIMISAQDGAFKKQFLELISKNNSSVTLFKSARYEQMVAVFGFRTLGSRADSAVTQLKRTATDTNLTRASTLALAAIASKAANDALLELLTNQIALVRAHTLISLQSSPSLSPQLTSAVAGRCMDQSPIVRGMAMQTFSKIAGQRTVAISLAMTALKDTNRIVQLAGIESLAQLNANSETSINAISNALSSNDQLIKKAASAALKHLQPPPDGL